MITLMTSDDEEDVFFDRSVMSKPLIAMAAELKKGQRFDATVFEEARALFYDVDELTTKEGVQNEVLFVFFFDM